MIGLDERLNEFWLELKSQAVALNASEFEFSVEIWGMWWMPWYVEIDGKSLDFTANDICAKDLELLVKNKLVAIVKVYEASEMNSLEIERRRYRIV